MEDDDVPATAIPLIQRHPLDENNKKEDHSREESQVSLERIDRLDSSDREDGSSEVDDGRTDNISKRSSFAKEIVNALDKRFGLVLVLVTAFCFALVSSVVKLVLDTINPFQAISMIVPIMAIGSVLLGICQRIPVPRDFRCYIWLSLSGISLSVNFVFFVLSITHINVADTTTILYTSLISVGILSWMILREPLRPFDFLFALLAFIGVVFVARPPFIFGSDDSGEEISDNSTLLGILFALIAAFSISFQYILIRKQSLLGIHTLFSMFFNSTVVVIVSVIAAVIVNDWTKPTLQDCLYIFLTGFGNLLGQTALYFALKDVSATVVTIMLTLEIVFSFLFQFLILGVSAVWSSYVGAAFVIGACIGVTIKNRPVAKAPDSCDDNVEQ